MTIKHYAILTVEFLVGCIAAWAYKMAIAADIIPVKQPVVVVSDSVTAPVVKMRTYRFVRPTVTAGIVVEAEKREASKYTIVEQPSTPFVWNGIFRDRVVIPRRKQLSVEVR
jgi:hypothetical protein